MTNYIIVKRSDSMSGAATSKISLVEFKSAITEIEDVRWEIESAGHSVKNSDGSISTLQSGEGVKFTNGRFHLVYEFYDGIALHTDGDSRVIKLAKNLADKLGAHYFEVT